MIGLYPTCILAIDYPSIVAAYLSILIIIDLQSSPCRLCLGFVKFILTSFSLRFNYL